MTQTSLPVGHRYGRRLGEMLRSGSGKQPLLGPEVQAGKGWTGCHAEEALRPAQRGFLMLRRQSEV